MFCEKCGAKITDGENFCTACGNPVSSSEYQRSEDNRAQEPAVDAAKNNSVKSPKKKSKLGIIIKVALILIVIVGIIKGMNPFDPDNNIIGIGYMRECYKLSQEVIRDYIDTPNSAEFPKFNPNFVTQLTETVVYDETEYSVRTVSAYVDYDNMFGVSIRSKYVVEIGLPSGESYTNYEDYIWNIVEFD